MRVSTKQWTTFLSDPGIPGVRFVGLTLRPLADLTDVTLADKDIKIQTLTILTDDFNRRLICNVAMQVGPSGGQTCN